MEEMEYKSQQIEALETLIEYSPKLLKGLDTSIAEYEGELLEDSAEYLRMTLDGVNWELSVLNPCLELINSKEVLLDRDEANAVSIKFNDIYKEGNKDAIAASLKADIKPLIEKITAAAAQTVAAEK